MNVAFVHCESVWKEKAKEWNWKKNRIKKTIRITLILINDNKELDVVDIYNKTIELEIFTPKDEDEYKSYLEIFKFYYVNTTHPC